MTTPAQMDAILAEMRPGRPSVVKIREYQRESGRWVGREVYLHRPPTNERRER
jgi:hypothetical protein